LRCEHIRRAGIGPHETAIKMPVSKQTMEKPVIQAADDEDLVRDFMRHMLEGAGYSGRRRQAGP
jgi:hypothetical protein